MPTGGAIADSSAPDPTIHIPFIISLFNRRGYVLMKIQSTKMDYKKKKKKKR